MAFVTGRVIAVLIFFLIVGGIYWLLKQAKNPSAQTYPVAQEIVNPEVFDAPVQETEQHFVIDSPSPAISQIQPDQTDEYVNVKDEYAGEILPDIDIEKKEL